MRDRIPQAFCNNEEALDGSAGLAIKFIEGRWDDIKESMEHEMGRVIDASYSRDSVAQVTVRNRGEDPEWVNLSFRTKLCVLRMLCKALEAKGWILTGMDVNNGFVLVINLC
jgi:hypothetical protein